jgi:hypothetical protein
MSEVPVHDEEQFVIESVTWLDGSPVSQRRRLSAAGWRGRLGPPGMLALAEGLAFLCCFSLPWFSMRSFGPTGAPDGSGPGPSFVSFSGWSIASGMPVSPNSAVRIALFVHLWLVPLTAGALLVIAWLCVQRRLFQPLAAGVILALSVLALLVELGYYVQVSSLALAYTDSSNGRAPSLIAVSWGCWLAIAVSVIATAAAANLLRPSGALPTPAGRDNRSAG